MSQIIGNNNKCNRKVGLDRLNYSQFQFTSENGLPKFICNFGIFVAKFVVIISDAAL